MGLDVYKRQAFGSEVNQLKAMASEKIEQKIEELKKKEEMCRRDSLTLFSTSMPSALSASLYAHTYEWTSCRLYL